MANAGSPRALASNQLWWSVCIIMNGGVQRIVVVVVQYLQPQRRRQGKGRSSRALLLGAVKYLGLIRTFVLVSPASAFISLLISYSALKYNYDSQCGEKNIRTPKSSLRADVSLSSKAIKIGFYRPKWPLEPIKAIFQRLELCFRSRFFSRKKQ